MWIMTWVDGVNEADAKRATTQAALKGAPRRLEVLKQPRACATDAAATVVLTRGLFNRDGTAVDLRAGAEDRGGCVDRPGDCTPDRFVSQMRKHSLAHVLAGLQALALFKQTLVQVLLGTGTWCSSWRLRQYGPDTV